MKFMVVFFALPLLTVLALPHNPPSGKSGDDYHYEYEEEPTVDEPEGEVVDKSPPTFRSVGDVIDVKEGDPVALDCSTHETTSQVLLFKKKTKSGESILYVGDIRIKEASKFRAVDNVFKLNETKRSDSGVYVCWYQSTPKVELQYTVNVLFPPMIRTSSPPVQTIRQGESVTLSCSATGNPTPVITWTKKDGKMPSGEHNVTGYSITLEGDRHVEGEYICEAFNDVGHSVPAQFRVNVEYPPSITTVKDIIRTGEGDEVELVCAVHARPAATVEWFKNGEPLETSSQVRESKDGHKHIITITDIMEDNFGTYECRAENVLGINTAQINLTDIPRVPHFTSDPRGAEDTSYTLTWETESYYPIQEYTLHYRKVNKTLSEDEGWEKIEGKVMENEVEVNDRVHKMNHTLFLLSPATDYEVAVMVKNKYKWGDKGRFEFSTRKEHYSEQTSTGSQLTLPGFIFLLAGIFTILS